MNRTLLILALTPFSGYQLSAQDRSFDHSHAALTASLKPVVSGGMVDYAALKRNSGALDGYLGALAKVTEGTYKTWDENQRLAYLINLYNAATLKLVVDHYPVKSIKDIGGIFSGPWKQKVVDLFGEKVTLDHVEHGIIRKEFSEPRAHFGLVCASVGCPPLRDEAFDASRLRAQLDEQGRIFMADRTKNRLESGVLYLSPIFDWFGGDFVKESGSVAKFVAPYLAGEADRRLVESGELRVKFTSYDWSLNGR